MDLTVLAFVIGTVGWFVVAMRSNALKIGKYHEAVDLTQQLKEIAENKQKDINFLKKICEIWNVLAPMKHESAMRSQEDAIEYLSAMDKLDEYTHDKQMHENLNDADQMVLIDAIVALGKKRKEIETFLDNFQD